MEFEHSAYFRQIISIMFFKLLSPITHIETIASGNSIREVKRLKKIYGIGHWKKRKGTAIIKAGKISVKAELHWYEAHGVGRKEFKIKKLLD